MGRKIERVAPMGELDDRGSKEHLGEPHSDQKVHDGTRRTLEHTEDSHGNIHQTRYPVAARSGFALCINHA
jgi:hypothetical protein